MKIFKKLLLFMLIMLISLCGFGGGALIWVLISLLINPSPIVFQVMFVVTCFVPMPFCWWIAPKIGEKYFN